MSDERTSGAGSAGGLFQSAERLSCAERFAPMSWLLSAEDLRFFKDQPRIAARFRCSRYKVFLSYWGQLHKEIAAFNRESLDLIARGAWDLLAHLCHKRAILLYHEARLLQAAVCYRWLPAGRAHADVLPMVRASLEAILAEVSAEPV